MTKTEIIKVVSERTGLTQTAVRAIVEAILAAKPGKGIISSALKKGDRVTISGFGTFFMRARAARKARNPKTGEAVKVGKRQYPAFKPSKSLREALKK